MKALVFREYGTPDNLHIDDVPKPAVRAGQLLICVHAASCNAGDGFLLRGSPLPARLMMGLFRPRRHILGVDVSGTVEEVGNGVTRFQKGDAVLADLTLSGFGGFAQYAVCLESTAAHLPAGLSFVEAAALPTSGATALQSLRDCGQLQQHDHVLVYGASGGVGTFSIQLAKHFGAEVTAVCSARKSALARELGADRVLDREAEDFLGLGTQFDFIHAVNGYRPLADYKRALKPNGRYCMSGGTGKQMIEAFAFGPLMSRRAGQKFRACVVKARSTDLELLARLAAEKKIRVPVEKVFTLEDGAEAIRLLESGAAAGKIVIQVAHGS